MNNLLNKKGFMMSNVLKIVLFALGLLVIIGVAAAVYGNIQAGKEEAKAKEIVDKIEGIVNALEDGQETDETILGLNGWFIAGWSGSDKNIPDKCLFQSCACVCKSQAVPFKPKYVESCQSKGFCRKIEIKEVNVYSILLLSESIKFDGSEAPKIKSEIFAIGMADKTFLKLIFKRDKDSIKIFSDFTNDEQKR